MFKPVSLGIATILVVLLCHVGINRGQPVEYSHPKSQVEYISGDAPHYGSKPNTVLATRTPTTTLVRTPPPAPANSKNFAFNPTTKTWTLIKPGNPLPDATDTIIWNQAQDKWLTNDPGSLSI